MCVSRLQEGSSFVLTDSTFSNLTSSGGIVEKDDLQTIASPLLTGRRLPKPPAMTALIIGKTTMEKSLVFSPTTMRSRKDIVR